MKKSKWIIFFLTIVLVLVATQNVQASTEKTITIGTTAQTYPNSYKKNNSLTGFDVDVAKAIGKKLGYKVKFKIVGDLPGLFGELDSGGIDTIANAVTVLPARTKNYNFSNVYSYYAAQIAVKKDSKYKTIKDLEGQTVSATIGSSNITLLKKYDSKIKIKSYDDRNAVFTDANNGTVSGVLNQRQFLQQTIKKQNLDLRIVKGVAGWNKAAFPFKKDAQGKKLQKKFNKALSELKKNGTLVKLSKKYFSGEDVTKESLK